MQTPDADSVRSALAYFKVSRGFAGIAKPDIGKKIASLLVDHSKRVTPKTAPTRVSELASAFERELDSNNLLSAASKLLWLRSRTPFVIYDSRAVRALSLEQRFDKRNYASYSQAWKLAYRSRQADIHHALKNLPKFAHFTAAADRGETYIAEIASHEWFAERVFDQYLWLVGDPKTTGESDEEADA
ncbi:hypothetical protein ACFPN2_20085 [Steroidobacter flavus]|uniref:Uncharacterized protein n=1 Tax=Steroidobacter flavus TaxID=1842136 RepID=A0ABV8SWD3_9GAMM